MNKKSIKVKLQQLLVSASHYRIVSITNAVTVPVSDRLSLMVGQQVTQAQADYLCGSPRIDVTITAAI